MYDIAYILKYFLINLNDASGKIIIFWLPTCVAPKLLV